MQEFNYHQHTFRCGHADMDMLDEDYVLDYINKGIKKIAFTDHCPQKNSIDFRPGVRMKYSEKKDYLNSINNLKEKYKDRIDIKCGFEVEYLPGEEENIKELKDETDIIVLGQHFVYDDNKNLIFLNAGYEAEDNELIRYAKYIDRALELGIPDIIAHPDFYLNVRAEFGKVEEKVANMICKSAEKYNVPIEINTNKIFQETYWHNENFENLSDKEIEEKLKKVKYPRKEFWEIASKYNVKVIYGIDTHHDGQIQNFDKLIELANRIIGKETIDKLNFIEL